MRVRGDFLIERLHMSKKSVNFAGDFDKLAEKAI